MAAIPTPPFNLDDLLHARSVETSRLEFKAAWGEVVAASLVRTVCAFANDLLGLNGGYVVLGVEEHGGQAILPPRGLEPRELDGIQKQIRAACKRIDPDFQPILWPVGVQERMILVVQAPAGETRPYRAPGRRKGERAYFVRLGSETVAAEGDLLRQLLEQAGKTPFDDRRSLTHGVEHVSAALVRRYLQEVGSSLVAEGETIDDRELFRRLRLVVRVDGHEVPRNVALLFFHEDPDQVFPGARIEVVRFADDAGGDLIEERLFRGPLPAQVKTTLDHVATLWDVVTRKIPGQAEALRMTAYPLDAVEEALVNAVYHRSYDSTPSPTLVRVFPDRLEVASYPGPVRGIRLEHFAPAATPPPLPARNRRIGDFLKELHLAEARGTGLRKIRRAMETNGSPPPQFDFDPDHTYFRVVLPIHPEYRVLHALREAAQMWALAQRDNAIAHLRRALASQPGSGTLAAQVIDYAMDLDRLDAAREVLAAFRAVKATDAPLGPFLLLARRLLDRDRRSEAREVLRDASSREVLATDKDKLDLAVLLRRVGDVVGAHARFRVLEPKNGADAPFLYEYATAKMDLAKISGGAGPPGDDRARQARLETLHRDAEVLLRRALAVPPPAALAAACWFKLSLAQRRLGAPPSEIRTSFERAIELDPRQPRYAQVYARWQERRRRAAADPGSKG